MNTATTTAAAAAAAAVEALHKIIYFNRMLSKLKTERNQTSQSHSTAFDAVVCKCLNARTFFSKFSSENVFISLSHEDNAIFIEELAMEA